MLWMRAVLVLDKAAHVAGDALSLEEKLDRMLGRAAPQSLADQGVRHAVEMLIEAHVIIDADAIEELVHARMAVEPQRQCL
jgi:thymidine phosphorylase